MGPFRNGIIRARWDIATFHGANPIRIVTLGTSPEFVLGYIDASEPAYAKPPVDPSTLLRSTLDFHGH
jgi:hypothetical protein